MEPSIIFSWTFAYNFLKGPMIWISFIIFILGTAYQVYRLSSLMQEKTSIKLKPGPGNIIKSKPSATGKDTTVKEKKNWFRWIKLSIAGTNPFMMILTTVFHLLLILLPFFVLGHNILLDNAFGISMISLPENVSDTLTLIMIGCAAIFLYRRMFSDRVKAITDTGDYIFLAIAAVPFITGYLAYHQIFENYTIVIVIHILAGELMLISIPFTKFIHMIYLVIVRFTVQSEYSLGEDNGRKTW
jgi:nitrate reductase gamma subunit